MIILQLKCGLGNQLFEYAYARSLMHKLGENKIYLDLHIFDNEPDGRKNALDNFCIPDDTIVLSGIKYSYYILKYKILNWFCSKCALRIGKSFDELLFHFGIYNFNFEKIDSEYKGKVHYLQGIFQNYEHFADIREEILECYQFRGKIKDQKNLEMLNAINISESVCVHIRRGDYVTNQSWSSQLLICNEKYYITAIETVLNRISNPTFFVFSNNHDDISWIKKNYRFPVKVNFVDFSNSDIVDFELMRNCKHFIISNSSFSWWAQYLSDYQSGVVVAPSYWDTKKEHYQGIYMDRWIEIEP
ncbi:MAG: alpha-1,2-fucosyltransferase [Lachnospiraceae bacterium]